LAAHSGPQLVPEILAFDAHPSGTNGHFFLVESRSGPSNGQPFIEILKEGETFETDFVDASKQDCQKWALENDKSRTIVDGLIAILDARSAKDRTLVIQFYNDPKGPKLECGDFGILPKEFGVWYEFRIDYKKAFDVIASFEVGDYDKVYSVYFGRKEELTDEHGVFDVAKAEVLMQQPYIDQLEDPRS
jgi:hypothetical protein